MRVGTRSAARSLGHAQDSATRSVIRWHVSVTVRNEGWKTNQATGSGESQPGHAQRGPVPGSVGLAWGLPSPGPPGVGTRRAMGGEAAGVPGPGTQHLEL